LANRIGPAERILAAAGQDGNLDDIAALLSAAER
jgi:hypothetical protein